MDREQLFGGNPLGVVLRLVVISIVVGIVMSALGINPQNLIHHLRVLIQRISSLGLGIFESALGYFLIGAVVVVPIWLVSRLLGAFSGRRDKRS
jgi:hypothetical protein